MSTLDTPTLTAADPCPCCGTVGTEKRTITVEIPDNLTANVVQADGSRQGVPLTLDPATTTWTGMGTIEGLDVELTMSLPAMCGPMCHVVVSYGGEAFGAMARPNLDPFRVVFENVEIGESALRVELA